MKIMKFHENSNSFMRFHENYYIIYKFQIVSGKLMKKSGGIPGKFRKIKKLKEFFKIEILTTTNRDLSQFKFLDHMSDLEKWLLASEGRPEKMEWLICTPK